LKKSPKQTCLDCNFLVKTFRQEHVFTLSDKDKENIRKNDFTTFENYGLSCYMGVWAQGVDSFNIGDRFEVIANVERKNFCFFRKYTPGMLLPAAKILQERESADSAASRDRRLTIMGLWIAAVALIANLVVGISNYLKP